MQGVQAATGAAGAALSGAAGLVTDATDAAQNITLGAVQGASQVGWLCLRVCCVARSSAAQHCLVQGRVLHVHVLGSSLGQPTPPLSVCLQAPHRLPAAAPHVLLAVLVGAPQVAGAVQGIVDVGKAIG